MRPVALEDKTTPPFGCSRPTQTLGCGQTPGGSEVEGKEPGTEPGEKTDINSILNPQIPLRDSTNLEGESPGSNIDGRRADSPVVMPLSEGQCLTPPSPDTTPPETSEFDLSFRRANGQHDWILPESEPSDGRLYFYPFKKC